mmetsp:Transcript_29574/g.44678  ORF Transcript_29574/g.44678 Transcript_29574/m.44678 type:complete len:493 (+) Transcript_29574:87-1565(+)
MVTMDREAQFLASQANRTAERDEKRKQQDQHDDESGNGRQRGKQRETFWSHFKAACATLDQDLENLLLGDAANIKGDNNNIIEGSSVTYLTASQRNNAKRKLDSTQLQLRSLQRHCLTPKNTNNDNEEKNTTPAAAGDTDSKNSLQLLLQTPVPELPPADLRMLSEEITKLSDKIDFVRERICPKEKFSFRRYRAALLKQQQRRDSKEEKEPKKNQQQATNNIISNEEKPEKKERRNIAQYEGIVEYVSDSKVVVQADGKVDVINTTNDAAASSSEETKPATVAKEASSFLMRNLKNCNVILNGVYKSVHFIQVEYCTIDITTPILQGSIHVTSCHNTTLYCASNQLRIHDSSDVDFHVFVKSGPIIEDCSKIKFYGDYFSNHHCPWGQEDKEGTEEEDVKKMINQFRDVKDFNWLRTLVPSPNFSILEESPLSVPASSAGQDMVASVVAGDHTSNIDDSTKKSTYVDAAKTVGDEQMDDGEYDSSDDEDEL